MQVDIVPNTLHNIILKQALVKKIQHWLQKKNELVFYFVQKSVQIGTIVIPNHVRFNTNKIFRKYLERYLFIIGGRVVIDHGLIGISL